MTGKVPVWKKAAANDCRVRENFEISVRRASGDRFTAKDPIGFGGGQANLFAYTFNDPINFIDPTGFVDLGIAGATGENSVHANPGPQATSYRPEHSPPHFHMGSNSGPRVSLLSFKPLTDADAKRMTSGQKAFCDDLSNSEKNLIRKRATQVYKTGSYGAKSQSRGRGGRGGGGGAGGWTPKLPGKTFPYFN